MSLGRNLGAKGACAALYLILSLYITIGETRKFTIGSQTPPSFQPPSPNTLAAHVLNLTAKPGNSTSAGYLQSLRDGNHVNGVYGLTPVNYVAEDQVLAAYLKIGTQSFQAQIDTGSSDTWVVGKGYQCGSHQPEIVCMFGPTYNKAISHTFKRIPNENFHITYADGSSVTGTFGNETVAIAGIPVKNQQFAIVDHALAVSDGAVSGLIGLAFPTLTQAYAGNDPSKNTKPMPYNPILTNLFSKGFVAPVFSLAVRRSTISSGIATSGLLAIGGLPPIRHSPSFARAPFQLVTIDYEGDPVPVPQYQYYTIIVDGFTYENHKETNWTHPTFPNPLAPPTNGSHHHAFVDSGTTLLYVPTGIANAVNALFDPPAVYDADYAAYSVNCSAKVPEFGIDIGGQTFFINGKDLILPSSASNVCFSGIGDVGSGMVTLGTVFLRNVLAVFDIGASEMRFAAREFY